MKQNINRRSLGVGINDPTNFENFTSGPKTPSKGYHANSRFSGISDLKDNDRYSSSPPREPASVKGAYNLVELSNTSLDQINDELDSNMSNMIALMNKRKILIQMKRRRMQMEIESKMSALAHASLNSLRNELIKFNEAQDNPQVKSIISTFSTEPKTQKCIQSIISGKPYIDESYEENRSHNFWSSNKQFENSIDGLLDHLRQIDSDLERGNMEVQEVCKKLDSIEENIRDLLLLKSDDHLKKAEPMFAQKQSHNDNLNNLLSQRTRIKDRKVEVIYEIIKLLQQLKQIRNDRIVDLSEILGEEDDEYLGGNEELKPRKLFQDFIESIDNIQRIKEQLDELYPKEEAFLNNIEACSKETELIFAEFVKRSSDEAKVFADFGDFLDQKSALETTLEFFLSYTKRRELQNFDVQDIKRKFKDGIAQFKPLIEEDTAIRQGLKKTNDTMATFSNILRAIENEKERRKELLRLLENCQRLKDDEENKNEVIREIELEITKKKQQKNHLEEDLDNILSDADLEQYKQLGNLLKNQELGIRQLAVKQANIGSDISRIQKEFINLMDEVKTEYEDIIKEVLPNNLMDTLDFQDSKDIRQLKNYMKKTFKRLGISLEDYSS